LNQVFGKRDLHETAGGRFVVLWLPVIVWAAAILVATSIPGDRLPKPPFRRSDLFIHAGLYIVLGFLLHRAFVIGTTIGRRRWAWLLVFAMALAYGIFDEVHQRWVPGRFCDLYDAIADGVGGLSGVVLYLGWTNWLSEGPQVSGKPPAR